MDSRTAITVHRARDEVERLWAGSDQARAIEALGGAVTFRKAPGDRGTEIHVNLAAGSAGGVIARLRSTVPRAKAKDELRHFKARTETGVIPRSDAVPEGERAERKLRQRPARPLDEAERQKVGAS